MTFDNSSLRKIEEIRPKKLVDEAKNAYLKDVEFYKLNQDKFTIRYCPGCAEKNSSYFCTKESFTFERCKSCLTIFMNPGPTAELVGELYQRSENYKYWSKYIYPMTKESRHEKLHIPRAEFIISSLSNFAQINKKINLLEIGAGDGGTLQGIHEIDSRIKLYAYEPNPDSLNLIDKSFVCTLNEADIKNQKDRKKFSAIILFEVLEHLVNPSSIFSLARVRLEPGGLLICSTPNALSLEVGALNGNSTTIDIEHISVLTPIAIYSLCIKNNLRLISLETPGSFDIELIQQSDSLKLFNDLEPDETKILQSLLRESLLSSHMRFVAQKN